MPTVCNNWLRNLNFIRWWIGNQCSCHTSNYFLSVRVTFRLKLNACRRFGSRTDVPSVARFRKRPSSQARASLQLAVPAAAAHRRRRRRLTQPNTTRPPTERTLRESVAAQSLHKDRLRLRRPDDQLPTANRHTRRPWKRPDAHPLLHRAPAPLLTTRTPLYTSVITCTTWQPQRPPTSRAITTITRPRTGLSRHRHLRHLRGWSSHIPSLQAAAVRRRRVSPGNSTLPIWVICTRRRQTSEQPAALPTELQQRPQLQRLLATHRTTRRRQQQQQPD